MKGVVLLAGALVAAVVVAVTADRTSTSPTAPVVAERAASEQAEQEASDSAIRGTVREAFDVAGYTYLRLDGEGGAEIWAAVSKASVAIGSRVTIADAARMTDFRSETLKRTFPEIYFGNLSGSAAVAGSSRLPPGHPTVEGTSREASPHALAGSPQAVTKTTAEDFSVSKATGPGSKTIAQLFAEVTALRGKSVRVRGRIVKATRVQGLTYYRVRDGSSAEPDRSELVISSSAERAVGEVVTFEGIAAADVDIGIGRKYPIMLQNARDLG